MVLKSGGAVRFVFSNAQPHNEIIYEMKSVWIPKLETQPEIFVGQEIAKPYETYLQQHRDPLILKAFIFATLPFVLWGGRVAVFIYIKRLT